MRHEILSVSKAKARLLDLTRKVQEDGRAYVLTRDGEAVSALVPIEDYESLLETMDVLADGKTMRDLARALADERHGRVFRRDKSGKWSKLRRAKRVA
jgi:prevent-host-death family protein